MLRGTELTYMIVLRRWSFCFMGGNYGKDEKKKQIFGYRRTGGN